MADDRRYEADEKDLPEEVIEGDFFLPEERPPTHPGEMLRREFLEPMGMTQRELADCMDVHLPRVNELINGKRSVTPQTAAMLARVFETSERFWLNLQSAHDLYELRNSESWEKVENVKQAG